MATEAKPLPDQYKNLRDEQSRLEGHRLSILISSSSITALSAVISQVSKDPLLQLILQIVLLISLIWGLSMYKSLSSQIFKAITYNITYIECDIDNKWLHDSMSFADKHPPVKKWVKQWTHIFTLLSLLALLLTIYSFRSAILYDNKKIMEATHLSIWWYLVPLGILQVIELRMWAIGVFKFDEYDSYLTNWKNIKNEAGTTSSKSE